MADLPQGFNETTDLYLQMLRDAQRVQDRRLVCLIRNRLSEMGRSDTGVSSPGCVIPFPLACPQALPSITPEEPGLWPRKPMFHVLSIFSGYWLAVLFFSLFAVSQG